MDKLERKFGKYAIKNLSLILIIGYAIGYVLTIVGNTMGTSVIEYLTLNPWKIIHGEVWRLFSWVLIPPSSTYTSSLSGIFFFALMMYCCFSIGTVLEKTWGVFRYNCYIFGGIILTVVASFISMGLFFLLGDKLGVDPSYYLSLVDGANTYNIIDVSPWNTVSTYYINMSIYLGFALTYPDNMVRFMFFIPIKMKWLGILDALYFAYDLFQGSRILITGYQQSNAFYFLYGLCAVCVVLAAVINIFIFWLINIKRFSVKQRARSAKFRREYNAGARTATNRGYNSNANSTSNSQANQSFYTQGNMRNPNITKHKCAICGQTERDNPNLEFRFCSKCNGAYEYCNVHIFTHVHKI